MRKMRSLLLAAAGLLIALDGARPRRSDYPNRPIRLIIPFPPGGSNDIVGRAIATQMGERLGKQVDRRQPHRRRRRRSAPSSPSKAPTDGYTLLVISLAHAVNPWLYKLPYDPIKAFTPIGIMGDRHQRARRASEPAGEFGEGADRARQGKAGRAAICLRRHRHLPASGRRAVQARRPRSTCCTCRSRAAGRP